MDIQKTVSSASETLFDYAVSIIFVPKTLIKILVNPGWVVEYLSNNGEKPKERFEKYYKPIPFWIITGILPYFFVVHYYFQNNAEGKVLEAYNNIGPLNLIIGISLFLACFPLSCAFVLHLFKHRSITKTTFKRSFNIQLYLTAPVQLFYIPLFFVSDTEDNWIDYLAMFSLLIIAWFVVAEIIVIRKETALNWFLCLCIFGLMYVAGFVFAGICLLICFLVNIGHFRSLVDAYVGDLGFNDPS